MRRLVSLRAAAFLAGGVALLSAPAYASDMSMTIGATTWNGNQFSVDVTVTNNAPNGSGAVIVSATGGNGVTGVGVTGGQDGGGGSQIPGGGSDDFDVNGTCSGSTGTVTITITYSEGGVIKTKTETVTLNKPPKTAVGRPIGHDDAAGH